MGDLESSILAATINSVCDLIILISFRVASIFGDQAQLLITSIRLLRQLRLYFSS